MAHPVKLIALVKPKQTMSVGDFTKRYLEGHVPFGLELKNVQGYKFNAINEALHSEVDLPPYFGIVEFWWNSVEEMNVDLNSPEIEKGVADADKFMDVTVLHTFEHILK